MNPVLFESGSAGWRTPPDLVAGLALLLGPFDVDPSACDASAAKAPRFWSPQEDGLQMPWGDNNFCNPPWRRANKKKGITAIPIMPWIKKAIAEKGQTTLLLAGRFDTAFFKLAFDHARLVMLIKGRLTYLDEQNMPRFPAPFPAAALVLEGGGRKPRTQCVGYIDKKGRVL